LSQNFASAADGQPQRPAGAFLPVSAPVPESLLHKGKAPMTPIEDDVLDNGGRRRLADRRRRTSAYRFPERRWLRHRRSGNDRRAMRRLRIRRELERRKAYRKLYGTDRDPTDE
jgi:hypothetical protein